MLRLVLLIATAAAARGLQVRETVRRVMVVRTSGSDLQPAATGYIYNKDDDGPERLVRMRETEVMEHLDKLYAHPHDERVIPVKEHQHEHVDGLADDDYRKIFDEYSASYGDERPYDYLKSLKRFKGALYHTPGGDSAEDDPGKTHRSGREGAGNYRNDKFESYSISRDHGRDDGDAQEKHHDHGHYRGAKKFGEDAGKSDPHSFRSVYDKSDLKDDHDYFDKGVEGFPDAHKYYGTGDRGGHKHYHYEPKHHDAKVEHVEGHAHKSAEDQGAKHSDTDATSDATGGAVEPQPAGDQTAGRSYGYKIKH